MRIVLFKFIRDRNGATLVEYGVALILAIIVGGSALSFLASDVGQNMDSAGVTLDSAGTAFTSTNTAE